MHKRIFGLETEYAIFHHQKNPLNSSVLSGSEIFEMINNVMDAEGIKRIYEEKFYPDSNSASRSSREERRRYSIKKNRMFLSNGGRFYLDTGDHPEFATPECIDPKEVLIYDKAGERILEELSAACEKELERLNIGGKIYVCKNNMDTRGNTYGCHENYLVIRRRGNLNESGFFKLMIKAIIPFLVTRQIFCGAGKIFSADTLAFQISQRADLIDSELSSDTTFRRGIINSRDEPLCQLDKYRRLHILVGDSNMSEISSFIKIGATGIVLQLIEEEEAYGPEIELEDPIKALREISKDPTCTCKVRLNNGQKVTALQIQREYLKRAQNHFNRATISLNNINKHILHLWENLLSRLEKDPANLRQEVDWTIKKSLIDKYLDRFKITPAELNRWTYIIKKIKGLRLEGALLFQNQVDKNFDVMSFLEERLSQADFLDLKKYCRTAELDLKDYFKSSKLYYGLLERDIKYHDIRQDRSIFYLLQKRGFVRRLNGKKLDEEINRAKHYPPLNTRAKIRGDFIRMLYDKKLAGAATWDTLTIYGNTTRKIPLLHPFVNQSIKLEDLLDKDTLKKIGRERSPH
jgi:hypothetical protein